MEGSNGGGVGVGGGGASVDQFQLHILGIDALIGFGPLVEMLSWQEQLFFFSL